MEAKSFPAHAKRQATDSEVATESLFMGILEKGERSGVFSVGDAQLAASLIRPLLQDWYIKRGKYRNRKTSIEEYIAGVSHFILGAIRV
jgi:hypothetical protein